MPYIHVKVTAGARKEWLVQTEPDHFKISVREKPERNQANFRVIELVARHFQVSTNQVRIVNGHRSPSKLLVVGE